MSCFSSLPWKLDNLYYHNQDLCQRQVDQLAKALKTCYETTPSPPLKEFVKRGKLNSLFNGIMFQKLFWHTVRKIFFSDREKLLRFEAKTLVFCYQNCSDLLWEEIVLAIEKNLWNSTINVEINRTIFGNRML